MVEPDEFKPKAESFTKVLGDLETDIMEALWSHEQGNVKDIHREVSKKRKVAITTVATVLDRLHEKGLVDRELKRSKGLYYLYMQAMTKKQFERNVVRNVFEELFERFGDSALSYLVDRVDIEDERTMEEFKRYLERLKREAK